MHCLSPTTPIPLFLNVKERAAVAASYENVISEINECDYENGASLGVLIISCAKTSNVYYAIKRLFALRGHQSVLHHIQRPFVLWGYIA